MNDNKLRGERMNKRGELITLSIVAFIIVAGSLVAGSYLVTHQDNGYVGDISTNKFYDYKCLSTIKTENRVLFESYDSAQKLNFSYCRC